MSSRTTVQAPTTLNLDRRASNPSSTKCAAFQNLFNELQCCQKRPQHASPNLPAPLQDRLDNSLTDQPYDIDDFISQHIVETNEKDKTVLYLAYGSNLCDETFLGRRGIKPISQINVVVPELRLTFDLPGIPYNEPCFANTARRDPTKSVQKEIEALRGDTADYHKNRWKKGLVGTVYEVSLKDYAHIIGTEGGGGSYHDIVVTCYPLPTSPTVPKSPSTPPFKAHTLFAPAEPESAAVGRFSRPDPSYAQPSSRYLKLMTDGAVERGLPQEYLEYLLDIRPYTVTSRKQNMGRFLFLKIWMPILAFMIALAPKFQDDKGRNPKWFVQILAMVFNGMWLSYDGVFKPVFGDGERTQKTSHSQENDERDGRTWWPRRGEKYCLNGHEHC